MDIDERIQDLEQLDQLEKVTKYMEFINELIERKNGAAISKVADHLLRTEAPNVVRPILLTLAETMGLLPLPVLKQIGLHLIESVSAKQSATFDEPIYILRRHVAHCLEVEGKFEEAAHMLEENMSSKGSFTPDEGQRGVAFAKICSLYLRCNTFTSAHCTTLAEFDRNPAFKAAADYHKRAAAIQNKIVDKDALFEFRVCDATVLNYTGSFLKAAEKFHKLSVTATAPEAERMRYLASSVNCLFLSPAGPLRSRLLSSIYKDDRSARLPVFDVLEAMFLERLVKGPDVEKVLQHLEPHQKPLLGSSLMSHNLLAASRIYDNITFAQLSALLAVKPEEAEDTASTMIQEGRMTGSIDQVAGMLTFTSGMAALAQWDSEIADVCHSVNRIADVIAARFPQLPK